MSPVNHVALMCEQAQTAQAVQAALSADSWHYDVHCVNSTSELAGCIERTGSAVALVDVDPVPAQRMAELGSWASLWNKCRLIVMANATSQELLLESMQIGARHFLNKSAIDSTLAGVIHRLVMSQPSQPPKGAVLTVLSASGGCGATTLAVNLASELQEHVWPVLLVDMDCCYGGVGTYLGLSGSYGLAEAMAGMHEPDPQLITSSATRYSDRLHVLLSPASVNLHRPAALATENLDNLIEACRSAYGAIVIDAGRLQMPIAAQLAHASRKIILLMQMTVKDIRSGREMKRSLLSGGIDEGAVELVVNRYNKRRSQISLAQCHEALGEGGLELLCNDYTSAVSAINYGQPLGRVAPSSPLRQDVRRLAERYAGAMSPAGGSL